MALNHVISHTPYPPSSQWIHVLIYKSFRLEQNHFTCDEGGHTFSHSCLGDYETKWSRAEHRFGGIWKDYGWCKWIIPATIREPLRPNYNLCGCWIRMRFAMFVWSLLQARTFVWNSLDVELLSARSVLIHFTFHLWLIMLILQRWLKMSFVCWRFFWMMLFSREQLRSMSLDLHSTWFISITSAHTLFANWTQVPLVKN